MYASMYHIHSGFALTHFITTAGRSKVVYGAVCTVGGGYEAPGVLPHHPP